MASGLATKMLFSSQFPVVDVGAVWMVKETFFLILHYKIVSESNGH